MPVLSTAASRWMMDMVFHRELGGTSELWWTSRYFWALTATYCSLKIVSLFWAYRLPLLP